MTSCELSGLLCLDLEPQAIGRNEKMLRFVLWELRWPWGSSGPAGEASETGRLPGFCAHC